MLKESALAPLHTYELYIEKLARLYPEAWHLVYTAAEMARGDISARIKIRMTMDIEAVRPTPTTYDVAKPGESIYKLLSQEMASNLR